MPQRRPQRRKRVFLVDVMTTIDESPRLVTSSVETGSRSSARDI